LLIRLKCAGYGDFDHRGTKARRLHAPNLFVPLISSHIDDNV